MAFGKLMAKLKRLLFGDAERDEHSLKLKSMRSAFWSMISKVGGNMLRLVGSLVLTRLLFPEAFGLMATATILLVMLQLFTDAGIQVAVIQNPRGDTPEFLNSAWVFAIVRGVFISLLVLGLAWPMGLFYHDPRLVKILLILAPVPLFTGFENPGMALLIKRFRLERQAGFDLGSQALGLVVTAILAAVFHSVYALAYGQVMSAAIRVFLSYRMQSYRPKLAWQREAGSELIRFGGAIFLNTMVTWVAMKADLLLVGRLLGMDSAGFYNLGERFGVMIPSLCTAIFSRAFMPAISSVQTDLPRVHRIYRRSVALVLALGIPLCMMLFLFAPTLVKLLYDSRYAPAGDAVRWLNLGSCIRIIGLAAGTTFVALNRVRYETIAMSVGAVGIVTLIPVCARFDLASETTSVLWVSVAVAVATGLIPAVESLFLKRRLNFPFSVVIRPWLQAGLCIGIIGVIHRLLAPHLHYIDSWNLVFVSVMGCISLVVSTGVYLLFEGRDPLG